MSEGHAIGRAGFPPRLLATGLTDEEAQAQLLPGEELAAIAAIPADLNAVYLQDGQLRPRTRLDFDAPAAGAMVSVDGAAPVAAVDWTPPTVPGTYRISAVGPFIGQRTIVVRSIEDARAQRWEATKAARDRAEWAGCPTQLGRVDTDPDSQRKVSGSVQMAMIAQAAGAPFDLAWTMQDNRTVQHDAGAMIAMGIAVGQHVAACHAVALAKRAAIEAADTVEAIAAVDIEGGWPDA